MSALLQAERLMNKARKLKAETSRWKQRAEVLEAENEALKQKSETERKQLEELSETIKIVKLARNISNGNAQDERVTELKRKINEYIKEIDICIAMLNEDNE